MDATATARRRPVPRWLAACSGVSPSRVRACLFLVVLACVIPAALAATVALWSTYSEMRAALVNEARMNARALARAVDGVIVSTTSRLEAMATSPSLAEGDLAEFEELARRVQPYQPGNNLVLSDANGQQLVNTAVARGQPLPQHGNRAFQRLVLERGGPAVSDLFVGGALKKPLIAIEVPVRRGAAVRYTLAMGFLPERFARILAEQRQHPDWVVSIFDSTGTIVARTHEAEQFVGHQGAPGLLAAMARRPDGVVETTTLEGLPVIAVYARSAVAHWTVAVGIPEDVLVASLERWIAWLVAISALLLLLGMAMAQLVAARIAGAIGALLAPARALGRGEPVPTLALPIVEVQDVADALVRASDLLRARTRERDQAAQARLAVQAQADAFEHAAMHDPLTRLPNRAHFMRELQRRVREHGERGGVFSVVFIDIDDFKPVNDRHGHAVGDELLCAFAARLRRGLREGDLVARLGGDEFAVLVDDHSPQDLEGTARELVESLARPYGVRELTLQVSACIGVAAYPADGRTPQALMEAADAAMYRAKSAGKRAYSR